MLSQLGWFKSNVEWDDGDRKIIRSLSNLDDGLGAFGCLPNEILVKIFSMISPTDNCRVSLTSKRIQNVCEDDEVWKCYFRKQNWHRTQPKSENTGTNEKSWKERFKTQYTLPSEFEARFLDVERRRDCLIDMKYVQLKKLERKFKVQQERLYRAIGGFVLLVYLILIYTCYKVLSPLLSLSFMRPEMEEAIGFENGNKIVDIVEYCFTIVYILFIAWIANRPAYRIYDQLINLLTNKPIAKRLPLFDISKFRKKQERIEKKFDPQIEFLNEQLKKMKKMDAFQSGVTHEIFFFKMSYPDGSAHEDSD